VHDDLRSIAAVLRFGMILLMSVFLLAGCGKDARFGEKCSFDDQCAPGKGVICQGADGIGYGVCGCDANSTWQALLGKCIENSFFEIKVGSGAEEKEGESSDVKETEKEKQAVFARTCQTSDDCPKGTGLECVLGKCLCHPPGDTMVDWLWSKQNPDTECRARSAKRYFGAKVVCGKNQPTPGEFYIPPRVWWNAEKGRCRSLKERRTLPEKGGLEFTDWGEAVRDIL